MKNFVLIGAGGYIAPKHLKAIKDTNNNLIVACDPNDSVGILDSYFPNVDFFTEFERFDRHLNKLKRKHTKIDYISICSPNYLHDAHIRFALKNKSDVICEKPLVLRPWNVNALKLIEKETKRKVNCIMQLRHHPKAIKLKEIVSSTDKYYNIRLEYITPRGKWYDYSWKGDIRKSGGITANIGIHLFDMLLWIFGPLINVRIQKLNPHKAKGTLLLDRGKVEWFLSIDANDNNGKWEAKRVLKVDNELVDFTNGFTDLHTKSYKEILKGNGFRLDDVYPSIKLIYLIRQAKRK